MRRRRWRQTEFRNTQNKSVMFHVACSTKGLRLLRAKSFSSVNYSTHKYKTHKHMQLLRLPSIDLRIDIKLLKIRKAKMRDIHAEEASDQIRFKTFRFVELLMMFQFQHNLRGNGHTITTIHCLWACCSRNLYVKVVRVPMLNDVEHFECRKGKSIANELIVVLMLNVMTPCRYLFWQSCWYYWAEQRLRLSSSIQSGLSKMSPNEWICREAKRIFFPEKSEQRSVWSFKLNFCRESIKSVKSASHWNGVVVIARFYSSR